MTETTPTPTTESNPYVTTTATDTAPPTMTPAGNAFSASNGFSISSLVLGIAAIPTGLAVAAIAAIVLGFVARSKEPAGRTMANWGIWLGFIGLFGWIIFAVFGLLLAAPFALLGLGWGWGF